MRKKYSRRIFLLTHAFLFMSLPLFAHGGEDHSEKSSSSNTLPPASEGRLTLKGRVFDVVLSLCDKGMTLYLADNTTNAPIQDAKIIASFEGGSAINSEATPTQKPGIYTLTEIFKEGAKVHIELKVSASDLSEKLSIDIPSWPKVSLQCEGLS